MGKSWIKLFVFFVTLFLSVAAGLNVFVDPLQQYKNINIVQPVYLNARYLNAGIAKSYDYDSLVIGTSMSENFLLNAVTTELGFQKPIKMTVSGASVHDINKVLKTAYKYNNINNVLYDIHYYSYTGDVGEFSKGKGSLPEYLYDDNLINDYQYLLNVDTIKLSFRALKFSLFDDENIILDKNHMYQWQHLFENSFGTKKLIKAWDKRAKDYNVTLIKSQNSFEKLRNNFDTNILPIVKAHPETTFYFYYPPYSILKYKQFKNRGWFINILLFKKYLFTALSKYSNVKLYDFQTAKEITHNLKNYRDISHYHQKTNQWMLQEIKKDNFRVTSENVEKTNKEISAQINDFNLSNQRGISE